MHTLHVILLAKDCFHRMNSSTNQHKNPWTPWFLMITSALGAFFLYLLYRWREQSKIRNRQTVVPPNLTEYHGLSDEEAQSLRSPDIDLLLQERQNELRKNILRRNVVSIFNISLLGLAISQLILRGPLGAFNLRSGR